MEAIRTDGDTDDGAAHLETRGAEQDSARDEGNEALAGDGKVKEAQGRHCRRCWLLFQPTKSEEVGCDASELGVREKRQIVKRAGGREPQTLPETLRSRTSLLTWV